MATKTLKILRPGRYGTRMLQAGDELDVNHRDFRLYTALGWAEEGRRRVVAARAEAVAVKAKPKAKRKAKAKK